MKTPWFFSIVLIALALVTPDNAHAQWLARHGLTSAEYQTAFNENAKSGYRLTNVSGYTEGGNERYAAVWEKASGPALMARHGLTAEQYQAAFDDYAKQGYRLTSISGYAVGNSARFAAIWEKTAGPSWQARHGLSAAQYQAAFDDYTKQGYRLQKVCGYVVGGVEYFAAIWVKGGSSLAKHQLTAAQFQSEFDSLGKQGYVVTNVSGYNKAGVDLYTGVWEKVSSPLRYVRHGIPASNYQNVFDNTFYQGYELVSLQAFASGSSARFNGVWTNNNVAGSDMAKLDGAIDGYMKDQNVAGASIAITKNGRLVFAKGYGQSNSGNGSELSPNYSMRVWSVSKTLTSVGIMTLLKDNPGLLEKKVFGPNSVLGTKYPTPAGREALNQFSVRQLLNMTSGLRTCDGETPFHTPTATIADAMSTLMRAPDLVTQAPDKGYIYSNTNFFFLARVIEQLSGKPYETYIRDHVLTPAGIGKTVFLGSADGQPSPGEAPDSPEASVNMQIFGGFGGWLARPMDLLKFLRVVDGQANPSDIIDAATHATMTTTSSWNKTYGLGWIVNGDLQAHNGSFTGGRSFLVELKHGLSYAVIVNSDPKSDPFLTTMKAALDTAVPAISKFPSYDLF